MGMLGGRGLCAPIGVFDRGKGSRFWTGDEDFRNGNCKIGGMITLDSNPAPGLSTYIRCDPYGNG